MKQATLERRAQKWERDKYFLDKATALLLNPAGLLIVGFVATNVLQHTHLAYVKEDTRAWWKGPGLPPDGSRVVDMTVITDDQANILRGGLVTAFANTSGLLDILKGIIK